MEYNCAFYKGDYKKIDFLNTLTNRATLYEDVRKRIRNVHSDFSIGRWQCLTEIRANELKLIDVK